MHPPLDPGLQRLVAPVREHLLPRLEQSLLACAERHRIAEGRGVDNFSFGTDAWSLPASLFRDAARSDATPFVLARGPGCVLKFDGCELRHHRVGSSENDDIATSFPDNAKALVDKQLSLVFDTTAPPGIPGDTVLAYMANPGNGLCAAYVTRVGRVEAGKIVEWSAFVEIFRRDAGPGNPALQPNTRAPIEHTPEPTVRRVTRRKREDG